MEADKPRMEDIDIDEKIKDALRNACNDNRIDCPDARALAEQLGVSYRLIGEAADRMGIKIKNCGLGCFN